MKELLLCCETGNSSDSTLHSVFTQCLSVMHVSQKRPVIVCVEITLNHYSEQTLLQQAEKVQAGCVGQSGCVGTI